MPTYVALLRGINLGPRNRVPMKGLAALAEALGVQNARTFIASGNLLFEAPAALAKTLPDALHAGIQKEFNVRSPVILRTHAELARLPAANPFLQRGEDPDWLHVAFLDRKPASHSADPKKVLPDEFKLLGREVFLFTPNGLGRSKVSNAFIEGGAGVVSTVRNWRTVTKLIELSSEARSSPR